MRYAIVIGIIAGLIGCGDVVPIDDGGAVLAGHGGTMGGAGTGGSMGGGGSGDCVPDACNTCEGGKKTPVTDGTTCAAGECSGTAVSPFGGTYTPVVHESVCQAGACVLRETVCDPQACDCGGAAVGYAGCFTDTGAPTCKCVSATGAYCAGT